MLQEFSKRNIIKSIAIHVGLVELVGRASLMKDNKQTKIIQWSIHLPMDFPAHWDDDMIDFHLNDSSWCCSNLIKELEKYDQENGCICGICRASVLN